MMNKPTLLPFHPNIDPTNQSQKPLTLPSSHQKLAPNQLNQLPKQKFQKQRMADAWLTSSMVQYDGKQLNQINIDFYGQFCQFLLYLHKIRQLFTMGPINVINDVLEQQIDALVSQINSIVEQHKPITDKAQRLSEVLKKLDLSVVSEKLTLMGQSISQNLNTIISDQQAKLNMIQSTDTPSSIENQASVLEDLMDLLNLILTIGSMIGLVFATSVGELAIQAVFLLLDTILGIINMFNNIAAIGEMEDKLAEVKKYFYGGQYEQDMKKIADVSYQMSQNFYMFVVGTIGLIHQLTINVNLLSISGGPKNINYKKYIEILKKSPFDPQFQKKCQALYENFVKLQSSNFQQRVTNSCKYLEDFENTTDFSGKIQQIANICSQFNKDSELGQQLQNFSADMKKIATIRESYKNKFEKRKQIEAKELPEYDADLFDDLLDQFRKLNKPELSAVELVSFFTIQFFADDPTGKTLLKMNLKELNEKTESLNYLGVNSSKQNIFYLPKPEDADLASQWEFTKKALSDGYRANNANAEFQFKRMYMRMQVGSFTVNNEEKSKLNFFYGILIKNKSTQNDQFFEEEASYVTDHLPTRSIVPESKISEIERESEDLGFLSRVMALYVNTVAYPERVIKLSIFRQGDKFKGVLVWDSLKVRPEYFGKIVTSKVYNLADEKSQIDTKGGIFYQETYQEQSSLVLLTFK